MVFTSRHFPAIAGILFLGLPAVALCQDDATRALLGSLASEDFKERTKAQRELARWAVEKPEIGQDWLFQEFESAGEPEVRIRLREVLKEVVVAEHQKDGPGYVGIRMMDVQISVPGEKFDRVGVSITQVTEDSPASRAGLLNGDVVISVDGDRWPPDVAANYSFQQAIMKRKPGDTVQLEILRGQELKKVPVTLAARPMGLPEASKLPAIQGFQGVQGVPGIRLNFLQPAGEDLKAIEEQQKADELKAMEECFEAWLLKRRAALEKP